MAPVLVTCGPARDAGRRQRPSLHRRVVRPRHAPSSRNRTKRFRSQTLSRAPSPLDPRRVRTMRSASSQSERSSPPTPPRARYSSYACRRISSMSPDGGVTISDECSIAIAGSSVVARGSVIDAGTVAARVPVFRVPVFRVPAFRRGFFGFSSFIVDSSLATTIACPAFLSSSFALIVDFARRAGPLCVSLADGRHGGEMSRSNHDRRRQSYQEIAGLHPRSEAKRQHADRVPR